MRKSDKYKAPPKRERTGNSRHYTVEFTREDCGPYFDEEEQKMKCPIGLSLDPWACWECYGKGCERCHHTGKMPACKGCKATEALAATFLWFEVNRPDYTIEVIEAKEKAKIEKEKDRSRERCRLRRERIAKEKEQAAA